MGLWVPNAHKAGKILTGEKVLADIKSRNPRVMGTQLLTYIMKFPKERIPEEWYGFVIEFWGTLWRHISTGNELYVQYLYYVPGQAPYVERRLLRDRWRKDSRVVISVESLGLSALDKIIMEL